MMMQRTWFGVAALALVGLGGGCATPQPVIRLVPSGEGVFWDSGRAMMTRELPGLRVVAAFERQEEELLALRVEVKNLGEIPIEVRAEQIWYRSCLSATQCSYLNQAINPDRTLVDLDRQQAEQRAAQKRDVAAGTILGVLGLFGAVASIASGTDGHAFDHTIDDAGDALERAERRELTIAKLEADKAKWSYSTFRRTTLEPNRSYSGLVYVRPDPRARWLQLGVYSRGGKAEFRFEQFAQFPQR